MSNIVIGVDPDCTKSGFAFYEDGELTGLMNLTISEYVKMLPQLAEDKAVLAIENADLIKVTYNVYPPKMVRNKFAWCASTGMDAGRICRQSVVMIELAESHGIKVVKYKPCKFNWQKSTPKGKDNANAKAKLLDLTGWDKSSNPETRSAAYFGHKYCSNLQYK